MALPFLLTAILLLSAASSAPSSPLDPKQLSSLKSLGLPTSDPCATLCDTASPFRHLLSLTLSNCSTLSSSALKPLSTLQTLTLLHCPAHLRRLPAALSLSLLSFTSVSSLRPLSPRLLSRLRNLSHLSLSGSPLKPPTTTTAILSRLKKLRSLTISNSAISGHLPKSWHRNLTFIDLSINRLRGEIHPSITTLETLISLNLSSNRLSGEIPSSIGNLIDLRNLSLSSNSLSGSVPETLAAIPALSHLDLSSNRLNGSVPKFLASMKSLKYLNLENNDFNGVLPFNASFIGRLEVFKVDGNPNLCYNQSVISSKVRLGISPCNEFGMPVSPPARSDDSGGKDSEEREYSERGDDESGGRQKSGAHNGPNRVVLGVAIALASIVFLIIFLILLFKRCA